MSDDEVSHVSQSPSLIYGKTLLRMELNGVQCFHGLCCLHFVRICKLLHVN